MSAKKYKVTKQGFMQGVIALMMSQIIVKLIGIIYKLYLTNKEGFGDQGNAIYNSGFQIYVLLLALSSVGVPNAISKLVSEKLAAGDEIGANRIFKIAFVLFSAIGLAGTLILIGGARYIANVLLQIPEAELTLVALAPSVFFVSLSAVIRGYFNGRETMAITANSQTLEQVFKTVFTICMVEALSLLTYNNISILAAGANFATTLSVFVSFLYLYKYYKHTKQTKREKQKLQPQEKTKSIIKNILKIAIPVSMGSIISAVNKNIDSVTVIRGLKNFLSEGVAKFQYGIYSGKVDTLLGIPLSVNVALAVALVPSIANSMAKGEKQKAEERISFCLLATMLIALPSMIGILVFASPILTLLFPHANEGAVILQISSLTILFMSLSQTINGALQGIGKYKTPAIALGVGVAIKLILNLILIPNPFIGINGASISSLVCHTISFIISYSVLKKNLPIYINKKKFILKPLIATLIMIIFSGFAYLGLCLVIPMRIATVIAILLAIIIYIISVLALRILNKEEMYKIPYGSKIYSYLWNRRQEKVK